MIRTKKRRATDGSGLLPPGDAGEKSDAGVALSEDQGIYLTRTVLLAPTPPFKVKRPTPRANGKYQQDLPLPQSATRQG